MPAAPAAAASDWAVTVVTAEGVSPDGYEANEASERDEVQGAFGGVEMEDDEGEVEEAEGTASAVSTAGEEIDEDVSSEIVSRWRSVPDQPGLVELPSDGEGSAHRPFLLPRETFDRLYPYQRAGVAWMARLYQNSQGGILADEMGLGKTIQVCALLNGARKAGATHALLLLPVTLLDQWAKEARAWCPGWPVYTYYGSASQRARALRRIRRPMGGLLLTSYTMIGNSEDMFEVSVDDAPSPVGRRSRMPRGERTAKRRRFDDDDGEEEVESEEELEPELPPGDLPSAGDSRPWDIVICDEAHRMKNISTLLGKSLRRLQSRCRLLLTGTPVQNALQDLWALMDFAQPGLLGNHTTFVKTFSEPIDRGSFCGAKVWAVELKKHLSAQLRALISPHLLRRTKVCAGLLKIDGAGEDGGAADPNVDAAMEDATLDDGELVEGQVKQLPPKKETIVWLAPSEEQSVAYKKILEKSEVIREACAKMKLGIEVFRAIGLLKRLCNHPMLLLPTPKPAQWAELLSEVTAAEAEALRQALADAAEAEGGAGDADAVVPSEATAESLAVLGATGGAAAETDDARSGRAVEMMLRKLPRSAEAILGQSAKLRCLGSLLPALAARGHRTLVFSQSVKMLDLVQICCLKPHGLRCLRIDGQTDPMARADKVAKFQQQRDRFQCMLLTTNVGGVGLNLTGADRVVLVDPAWNPATDAQAVDRAFRIGQDREVRVYRLIMSGLIEDKMFRLQVFKMGLTKTALEADQQHRYFSAREIRALFEWTEPEEGETRRLLREKHGDTRDEAVMQAAEEDGADEWMEAGLAIGLSDFTALYGAVAQEEEPDDACAAQVLEAKLKLCAADEKLQQMRDARLEAEAQRDASAKELDEACVAAELLKEKRSRGEDAVKEKRTELTQARRAEASAQQRLEKASRARGGAQDQQLRAQQAVTTASEATESAARSSTEAASSANNAEEALAKVIAEAEAQLAVVGEGGLAVGNGAVDAAPDRWKKALKALEKLRAVIETVSARQDELDAAEEELLKADAGVGETEAALARLDEAADVEAAVAIKTAELTQKSREKDRQRAEQAQGRAQQRAEASRETAGQAAQALAEAGLSFVESFGKTQSRPVKVDQVKAAQSAARAAFRQLQSSSTAVKKSREAHCKATTLRRKAAQRFLAGVTAESEAAKWLGAAEHEYSEAAAEEEAKRGERGLREADLAAAEGARGAAEMEEAETKRRRDELKAAQPGMKELVRVARAAEKEAALERQALHAACSKVEKAQLQLEEAKNSAVQTLKAEEYDTKQVEQAYEQKRKVAE